MQWENGLGAGGGGRTESCSLEGGYYNPIKTDVVASSCVPYDTRKESLQKHNSCIQRGTDRFNFLKVLKADDAELLSNQFSTERELVTSQ